MIEVVKDHCPACWACRVNTNVISRKMEALGISDAMPIYRMHIMNELPWLGNLPHSPLHIYLRKEDDAVVELKLLDSPLPQAKTDSFLSQIGDRTNVPEFISKIKIDVLGQRSKFLKMEDLDAEHDVNFDTKAGYVKLADRQK